MAADEQIPPVTSSPVDDAPSLPPIPTPRPSAVGNAFVAAKAPAAPPADEQLASGVQRAQISLDAVSEPRSVETRATVHDAAVHGSGIARAIEAAQRGTDAHLINQQLGGAAAAAASGRGAQIERSGAADEDELRSSVDPLAAAARIGDEDERHRRQQHESELSARDDEDGVEQSVQQDR